MTKVPETEPVCPNDQTHKRPIKTGPREQITCGPLKNDPGHWLITGIVEGDSRQWARLRKPDGSYWNVVSLDYGISSRIGLGDQIVDKTELAYLQSKYDECRDTMK